MQAACGREEGRMAEMATSSDACEGGVATEGRGRKDTKLFFGLAKDTYENLFG